MKEDRYTLAAGKSDGELIETVNGLIGQGWAPIGGPVIADQNGKPILLQAVVRPPSPRSRKVIPLRKP